MATAHCALVFTGLVAFSVVGSFAFQAYHMWKTKNFRFMHKDIFTLFLVGAILFSVAFVAGKNSILNQLGGSSWMNEPVRWIWVGFSIFMSITCLGLLSFAVMNNGKSLSLNNESSDGISDLHSYSAPEEEEEETLEASELVEGGEIPSNLQGNV